MAGSKETEAWDERTWSTKYVKFTHGCMVIDCVESELKEHAKITDLLSFYGLYRQIMSGDNNSEKPLDLYPEKRLRWNAWTKCRGLTKKQAFIKWERLYTKFIDSFPSIFRDFNNADLRRYDPLQPFLNDLDDVKMKDDEINTLQLEIKGLRMELALNQKQENKINKDEKYISLKQEQYQQIIEYVNQLKNKMKKYHNEFEKNVEKMKILKQSNDDLKHTISVNMERRKENEDNKQSKRNKKKLYWLAVCLFIVAVLIYIYKKRKGRK